MHLQNMATNSVVILWLYIFSMPAVQCKNVGSSSNRDFVREKNDGNVLFCVCLET